jgi:hypothetical protein
MRLRQLGGPNVCIEAGTVIKGSTLTSAIIGRNCRITRSRLVGAVSVKTARSRMLSVMLVPSV